jgi:site-specific DNA recombinase
VRAAGYIRVSTQEQVDKGWNLDEDRKLIEARCEERGWELVAIFDDGGRQGDDPDRPGLRELLDTLDELDVVVLRSQDRISRDIGIWAVTSAALRAARVQLETFSGPIDLESPAGEFMANVMASVGKFEKRQTGQRVRQALSARASAGLHTGGQAPFGYAWRDKTLVVVPHEAEVVRRIYRDYISGMGQRAVVRALNEEGVPTRPTPTRSAARWYQSAITRVLSNVVYTGKLDFKGDVTDGSHHAIVSEEDWNRAQAIRTGALRRKGGRHPDGRHLLTRGILRCTCGSAMIPRKERVGVERERYVCGGRIEHGPAFCSQPSIRRELIDEPFLAHLLDGYIDIEATTRRIDERMASALTMAREALVQAEHDAASAEAKLARVRGHYQEGKIEAEDWAEQRRELTAGVAAAQEAVERARAHLREVEQGGVPNDAEQLLLEHLAAIKQAVTDGVGAAPDLAALRNVIGQMFESVELVRADEWPRLQGQGFIPFCVDVGPVPTVADRADLAKTPNPRSGRVETGGYYLFPRLRWSSVDSAFKPMRQAIPWSPRASGRPGRTPRSPSDNRTPTDSCAGTAGGSPRRSRTHRRGRSQS